MQITTIEKKKNNRPAALSVNGIERLRVWQKAQKVWKKRTNVDLELKRLRKSWDRKLPKLK